MQFHRTDHYHIKIEYMYAGEAVENMYATQKSMDFFGNFQKMEG